MYQTTEQVHASIRAKFAAEIGDRPLFTKSGSFQEFGPGSPDIDEENRIVKGIVSTAAIDGDNEVVIPRGLDRSYFPTTFQTVYLGHDVTKLVGACRTMFFSSGGRKMHATTYLSKTALGEDTFTMMKEGVIRGFSITFLPIDIGSPTQKEIEDYGRGKSFRSIVRSGKLFDYVITPRPCNDEALVGMLSKGLIRRESAVAFGMKEAERKIYPSVAIPRVATLVDDGSVIYAVRR